MEGTIVVIQQLAIVGNTVQAASFCRPRGETVDRLQTDLLFSFPYWQIVAHNKSRQILLGCFGKSARTQNKPTNQLSDILAGVNKTAVNVSCIQIRHI